MKPSNIKTTIYLASLLLLAACDTTEDAFWVGDKPENAINAKGPVTLNADGTAVELDINSICAWTVSVEDNENNFAVTPSSGKGSMSVEVTASPNYNNKRQQSCKLVIRANELDEQVTVDVTQAALVLEMEQGDVNVPETGDTIRLDFTSTAGWVFETWPAGSTPLKDIDWMDFIPGYSGDGDYRKIQIQVAVQPNYTLSQRTVTLGLNPQSAEVANQLASLPQEFSITQAAGTPATIAAPDTVFVSKNEIECRYEYSSVSAVDDCGVKVLSEDGQELKTVPAQKGSAGFASSGAASVVIDNLDEGSNYGIQPYVVNKVCEALGEVMMVSTKSTLTGATIKDYSLTPSSRGVSVRINAESDAYIQEVGIKIFPSGPDTDPIAGESVPVAAAQLVFDGEITVADTLTPNTDYNLVIYVKTSVNETGSLPIPFRTAGLIPEEDDNNRPEAQS